VDRRGVVETCGQRGPARVAKSAGVTYVGDPAILDRIGPASDD
jgi:hypothetical protein